MCMCMKHRKIGDLPLLYSPVHIPNQQAEGLGCSVLTDGDTWIPKPARKHTKHSSLGGGCLKSAWVRITKLANS